MLVVNLTKAGYVVNDHHGCLAKPVLLVLSNSLELDSAGESCSDPAGLAKGFPSCSNLSKLPWGRDHVVEAKVLVWDCKISQSISRRKINWISFIAKACRNSLTSKTVKSGANGHFCHISCSNIVLRSSKRAAWKCSKYTWYSFKDYSKKLSAYRKLCSASV